MPDSPLAEPHTGRAGGWPEPDPGALSSGQRVRSSLACSWPDLPGSPLTFLPILESYGVRRSVRVTSRNGVNAGLQVQGLGPGQAVAPKEPWMWVGQTVSSSPFM